MKNLRAITILRISSRGSLWILQKRKKILLFSYWSTIYSSSNLADMETRSNVELAKIRNNFK